MSKLSAAGRSVGDEALRRTILVHRPQLCSGLCAFRRLKWHYSPSI